MVKISTKGIYRDLVNIKAYKNYYRDEKPSENCVFCGTSKSPLYKTKALKLSSFKIVMNDFPYDFWDMKKVTEHLMAVPIRHIDCVSKLNREELEELNKIMAHFSDAGHDIFVRSPKSAIKSIDHLHFHLIKTEETKLKVEVTYEDSALL
jgi:diadenosine tetraphosphate (Ap4A) HIT family hydrolase